MDIDVSEVAGLEKEVRESDRPPFLNEPGEYSVTVDAVIAKQSFAKKENLVIVNFEITASTNPDVPVGVRRSQCMRMDSFDYGKKDLAQFSMAVRDSLKDTDKAIDDLETVVSGVLDGLAVGLDLKLRASDYTTKNGVNVTKYHWAA